jgi:16S rRNA pseudouridine516 synthase
MHYYMLNKPRGLVTAKTDADHPTVMECFPEHMRDSIHPVGRLDIDTCGLLLFTDDGICDRSLLSPECHVEKTYRFYAFGEMTREQMDSLQQGVSIGNGRITQPARIEITGVFEVKDMEHLMPDKKRASYMKNPHGKAFSGTLSICEGKKHQVKLMLKAVGCKVLFLERSAFGELRLDPALRRGEWRELTAEETEWIKRTNENYIRNWQHRSV